MYSRTDYRHHVLQDRFQAHFTPGQITGTMYSRTLRPRLQQSVPWLNWPDRIHHVSSLLCTVLYCILLYCIALYCIVLHCTVFYCTARHSHGLYSAITYNIVGCSILQYSITPVLHKSIMRRVCRQETQWQLWAESLHTSTYSSSHTEKKIFTNVLTN